MVVGCGGDSCLVQLAGSEMVWLVEGRCAGELHNDAVKVAAFLTRTNRLRAMYCSWLVGGGTQGAVRETEAS